MKLSGLVAVHHIKFNGVFLVEAYKIKDFIKLNTSTWKEYNIDPETLTIAPVSIKSNYVERGIQREFPEWFL